jgi:hypothetical protein
VTPSRNARSGLSLAAIALLGVVGGCCSTPDKPCAPQPRDKPTLSMSDPPNIPTDATPMPLPRGETPEDRNERLMRLEWAQDQWWAATQRQEYEKQASLESLLRTYVSEHFDAIASDLQTGSPRHRRTMAMALGFSGRQDAVPLLEESLKDQYSTTRSSCTRCSRSTS